MARQMNEIVCDAIALLRNCGQAVRLSALHTYYSALPLTPKTRELFKCYSGKPFGIPDVICSHPLWESVSVRVLEGHTSMVPCAVFSPDGRKLASASGDCTLRLWDVESGQPIGDPLKGHTDGVDACCFFTRRKETRIGIVGQHVAALGRRARSTHRRCTQRSHLLCQACCFFTRRKETRIGILGQHVAALGRRARSTHRRCTQRSHLLCRPRYFFTRRKEARVFIAGQDVAALGCRDGSTHW